MSRPCDWKLRALPLLVAVLFAACSNEDDPLRRIDHPDPPTRATAATELGERGGGRALDALRRHVGDPESRVRVAVAHALGEAGEERHAPDVGRLLGDEIPSVRLAAVEALVQIGGDPARRELVSAITDGDPDVRVACRRALGELGMSGQEQVTHVATARRSAYVEQAGSGARGRRLEAARALAECGDEQALVVLARLARDEEADVASLAAAGIGRAGAEASWSALEPVLADERPAVRLAALDGLAMARALPADADRDRICALLSDPDTSRAAASAVATHRLTCLLGPLVAQLSGEDALGRIRAAEVLALVVDEARAEGDLAEVPGRAAAVLWTEAPLDRLVAVAALETQPAELATARVRREVEAYVEAATRWVPLPDPERPEEPPTEPRPLEAQGGEAAIAELLSRYRPRVPRWVELFTGSSDPETVAGVLTLAAELDVDIPREMVDGVATSAPDPLVRAAAVASLGPGAAHLEDDSSLVRIAAADAMARRGPELPDLLRARLASVLPDGDPDVRAAAARALAATGDPSAVAPLLAAFERWRDPEVARALGALGRPEAAEALAAVLRRPALSADPTLAAAALLALARVGSEEHLEAVVAMLEHPASPVRAAAVAAARAIGGARGAEMADERRGDFARTVREAAALEGPAGS